MNQAILFMPSFRRYLQLSTASAFIAFLALSFLLGVFEALFLVTSSYALTLSFHQAARGHQRVVVSPAGIFALSSLGHPEKVAFDAIDGRMRRTCWSDSLPVGGGSRIIISGLFFSKKERSAIYKALRKAQLRVTIATP